ncbi:MAG: pyridoxamine 5'-phosphate oxidase family protein [Chloroflexota bacterium]
MTTMTKPGSEKNLDGYGSPPLEWDRVMGSLEKTPGLDAEDAAGRTWLATTRPDGRPHVMPVGAIWDDNRFYFTAGAGTRKARNLASDARCTITVAAPRTDIVTEGEARIVRDEGTLRKAEKLFEGWGPTVRDGAFWHEFSAPSAGPPPWDVYEFTPTTIFGLSSDEPHGATCWRLSSED